MKILVNCYACSPYEGSEPGMGWNFVKNLARYHDLHVITESKFQLDLEKYFSIYPNEQKNLTFHFITKNRYKKLRKIWPPSYYWFYKQWQKKALKKAIQLESSHRFDIIHQLNMIGYREPGYLWKINKPFVWGPIGGFHITPWKMLASMGIRGFVFYFFRNIINVLQMHFSERVREAICRSDALISATKEDADTIESLWNRRSNIIPEVGGVSEIAPVTFTDKEGKFKICWSGVHEPRKSLNLLLDALSLDNNKLWETHVMGKGSCTKKWKRKARQLALDNIVFHGWTDRQQAVKIMSQCDVFVITSLSDATSTVLLEALSYGLPVIALNHCGFANVLNDHCGIKISVNSEKQIIRDIAQSLNRLYASSELRSSLSTGAVKRVQDFTWEKKVAEINDIYEEILRTKNA